MYKKIIIILIVWVVMPCVAADVHAQTNPPAEEPVKLESLFNPDEGAVELHVVKEHIRSLLRQNEELFSQAQSAKEEFLGLREKVERSRAEVTALQKESEKHQEDLKQAVENMRKSGQPQSLQLLQSYDRQYAKKQLEIELKLQELALREKQQALDRQLVESQKEIEENAALEKDLTAAAEESKKNSTILYELECLKQENILLENQLKLPVTAQSSVGMKPEIGASGESIRRKEEEKTRLERDIAQLQEEQERSSSQGDVSVFETQFRGSVKQLEEENKQLKDQISSYRKKIQERSR